MDLENRMISAEWLKTRCYEICDAYNTSHVYIDRIIDEIDNAPDVEVVRCRDCNRAGREIETLPTGCHYQNRRRRCPMAKPKIYGIRKPIPINKKKGKKAPWEK